MEDQVLPYGQMGEEKLLLVNITGVGIKFTCQRLAIQGEPPLEITRAQSQAIQERGLAAPGRTHNSAKGAAFGTPGDVAEDGQCFPLLQFYFVFKDVPFKHDAAAGEGAGHALAVEARAQGDVVEAQGDVVEVVHLI